MNNKYDIFISYRRKGGKNYARTLKPELEKRGYRVFLDFDELKDGVFDKRIMDAISGAPIFMVILSEGALDRCANDGDWVREEILYADKTGRHIVPVEVDKTFREFPANLPDEIKSVLGPHQFSQIDTETLLQESIDKMVRERVKPYITKESTDEILEGGEVTDGAEIHIEVDTECDLFRFKKLIKSLHVGQDNVVYLMPGKHKVDFVSKEYPDIKESQVISIPSAHYSDFIEITFSDKIAKKKQEEERLKEEKKQREKAQRKAEEDAKRKAEEERKRREEEARRKAELAVKRKAEEEKRKVETETGQGCTADAKLIQKEVKNGILHKVNHNSKWGFVDEKGNVVVPFVWDEVDDFIGDYALVWDKKRFGIIDAKGNLTMQLVKRQSSWTVVRHLGHGMIKVGSMGEYGLINIHGRKLLPEKYKFFGKDDFSDGYLYVKNEPIFGKTKELRIDINGNIIEGWK